MNDTSTYPRTAANKIDWRKLLNPAHIVFNTKNEKVAAEIEKAYGAPAKSLVYAEVAAKQEVSEKHILVLLKGWQDLAELRGFTRSVPVSIAAASDLVTVAWQIDWVPNEDDPKGKTTGATADATMENTGGWGYLGAMAGNRAFCRAVRQGLGIQILSFDEIAAKDAPPQESGESNSITIATSQVGQPVPTLIRVCQEAKVSFEAIKKGATTKYRDKIESDPSTWTKFEDVPPRDCLTLITLVKEGKKKA